MPYAPTIPAAGPGAASLSRQGGAGSEGQVGRSAVDAFDPKRLRDARTAAGLTQRDLAVKLLQADLAAKKIDPSAMPGEKWAKAVETERIRVISYEQGTHTPRAQLLRRLADAIGVDGFELFREGTPRTLATLRIRLGLTQDDVAEHLHTVGRAYYSRIEQGRGPLQDEDDRRRLAELLQVEVEEVRALSAGASAAV
jgi:transcriptional regulator with XRE-family HTH domain